MKVLTILGTRPEIIRLSRIIPALDALSTHRVIHTGQNYDARLSDIFFQELGLRAPDAHWGVRADGFGAQIGQVLAAAEQELRANRPDAVVILGDTNSGLAALVACRLGIPVFHLEAGNRCYDDRVPEETNRRIIDHSSRYLLPYTERSRANLLREGIPGERIFVVGNPIAEVLDHYAPRIEASAVLDRLKLERGGYFLVTLHREENVDAPARLDGFIRALEAIARTWGQPVVCSVHPRTRSRLEAAGRRLDGAGIMALEPLGLFDFVHLERGARCVLSDSGTVQEECAIFRVPNVTLRDVTERPETLECGSGILSGGEPDDILRAVRVALSAPPSWQPPAEYQVINVSRTVVRLVLGGGSLDASRAGF